MENYYAPQLDLEYRPIQVAIFTTFDDDEKSLGEDGREIRIRQASIYFNFRGG